MTPSFFLLTLSHILSSRLLIVCSSNQSFSSRSAPLISILRWSRNCPSPAPWPFALHRVIPSFSARGLKPPPQVSSLLLLTSSPRIIATAPRPNRLPRSASRRPSRPRPSPGPSPSWTSTRPPGPTCRRMASPDRRSPGKPIRIRIRASQIPPTGPACRSTAGPRSRRRRAPCVASARCAATARVPAAAIASASASPALTMTPMSMPGPCRCRAVGSSRPVSAATAVKRDAPAIYPRANDVEFRASSASTGQTSGQSHRQPEPALGIPRAPIAQIESQIETVVLGRTAAKERMTKDAMKARL